MTLLADAGEIGLAGKYLDYGILGVTAAVALLTTKVVAFRYAELMEKSRSESRQDLLDERKARQTHEDQVTKILSELVTQVSSNKESIKELSEQTADTAKCLAGILEELRRIKVKE